MTLERDRQQLRHARERLAEAEGALLNASAMGDGNSWGAVDPQAAARAMNRDISAARGIDDLRAEVARLEAVVGPEPAPPSPLQRLRRWLGAN